MKRQMVHSHRSMCTKCNGLLDQLVDFFDETTNGPQSWLCVYHLYGLLDRLVNFSGMRSQFCFPKCRYHTRASQMTDLIALWLVSWKICYIFNESWHDLVYLRTYNTSGETLLSVLLSPLLCKYIAWRAMLCTTDLLVTSFNQCEICFWARFGIAQEGCVKPVRDINMPKYSSLLSKWYILFRSYLSIT